MPLVTTPRPWLALAALAGLALPSCAPEAPASQVATAARPDILIVILDAARARSFGAYGYPRDTTPFIDRLATGGLAFDQAFSECPTTSCSIPNLISGLPFVDVGAANEDRRIDDRITTLAESLQAAGYWTLGISANPANSVARNSNQGFGRFDEMWAWPGHDDRHPERFDPHQLSRRAIEALGTVPPDQPLFMQLHYIPPHEPYDPRPEFDIFGDPAYTGSVSPGVARRGVRAGRRTLSEADVEELIALYDGNLRMADDAVELVFEALRAAGRWDNTVVLVTADHGEAFFEHGRQGHNSTLYDEMLHVPFILRLPGDARPDVDTQRLVTLSDVTPTLLGLVGLPPQPGVNGVDLLNSATDPERAIFLRRASRKPTYAVRTTRWKAIFPAAPPAPELYDLADDPLERNNLAAEHPDVYRDLETLLARHLEAVEALQLTSEEFELSDAEREALRSLGYVR